MLIIGPGSVQQVTADGKVQDLTPRPPQESLDAIVQSDREGWAGVAKAIGMNLVEIEAQYRDKTPITPWHKASIDGAELVMGTRFRVYAVKVQANEFISGESWNEILRSVPERTAVNPQWLDGRWVGNLESMTAGGNFEIHVDRGAEAQLINLLAAIKEHFQRR